MSDWDRVERLIGSDNLARLRKATVAVVGLGSGGGFVAQAMAMSGVGRFVLVDNDVIEPSNIVRHIADNTQLGQPKVDAVADNLRRRADHIEVDTRQGYIEDHWDALDGVDLVVVGVDQEQVKYKINERCLEKNLTAVYAGVYERGEGGDVVIVRPNQDGPCYACWAAELREGIQTPAIGANEALDYGMIGDSGTLDAEPGLWLHVVRVASVQADIAVNELLAGSAAHEEMPGNTVIMANRHMEIMEGVVSRPYTAVWTNIPRDQECLVCGDAIRRQKRLADSEAADDSMSLDDLMGSVGLTLEDEHADE
jgi:molybdopterin/thiamine biosynthesis adenylyltransferase